MLRRAFTILALLLLGAIINVAVAWWCACRPFPIMPTTDLPGHEAYRRDNGHDAILQIMFGRVRIMQLGPGDSLSTAPVVARPESAEAFDRRLPRSSVFRGAEPLEQVNWAEHSTSYEDCFGWPCLALTSRLGMSPRLGPKPIEDTGRLSVGPQWQWLHLPPTLPSRPVWPGFAINTAIFTTGLWLLFAAPMRVAGRMRRRANSTDSAHERDVEATK